MKGSVSRVVSRILTVLIIVLISVSLTLLGCLIWWNGRDPIGRKLEQIRQLIDDHSIYEFSGSVAESYAVSGYLNGLYRDNYTQYWTASQYKEYLSSEQGNYSGIGVTFHSEDPVPDSGLYVYYVNGNSPAQAAGIRAGDRVVAVAGEPICAMAYSDAYALLRKHIDQPFELTLARNGAEFSVTLKAEDFVRTYVDSRKIGEYGYIRIESFRGNVYSEFQTALNDLMKQGVRGWIFDLRQNPGGSLSSVENILDLLIPEDEMVIIQTKDRETVTRSSGNRKTDLPMTVLIDGESASAAELMASCLRDVNGSLLVGTRSFGKGIGQTTYELSDGSAVKMTSFYYLTKSRNGYHGVGLQPDVTVKLSDEQTYSFYELTEEDDPQLQQAIAALDGSRAG